MERQRRYYNTGEDYWWFVCLCFFILTLGPEIIFQKINPTKYRVKVKNATEPFWLVFSESYHPQWKAFTGGEEVGQHLVVNGYANAWYVNKTGTYDIILSYQGEKVFRCTVILSLITLLSCILYLAKVNPVRWVQKKYRR